MTKIRKPTSKRQSTRHREGIKKKVAAHHRKQKKMAKKDPTWKSKHKKDPGIPNSFPYKASIIAKIEEKALQDSEEKRLKREALKESLKAATSEKLQDSNEELKENDMDIEEDSNPMAALLASAQQAAKEYNGEEDSDEELDSDSDSDLDIDLDANSESENELELNSDSKAKRDMSKAYDKLFKKLVNHSDVILYVLDARDPEHTRSKEIERFILSHPEKRLLLILNKIDLVPSEVVKKWIKYLRLSFPTLPFAASHPAPNAHTFKHQRIFGSYQQSATTLINALKTFASKSNLKRSILVGVVGYPNVGKSSIINALKTRGRISRSHHDVNDACPVGAQAGVTTSLREIKIDSKLRLLDSPGIVFPDFYSNDKKKNNSLLDQNSRLVLLSALPPKQITDPIGSVNLIFKTLLKSSLLFDELKNLYGLPALLGVTADQQAKDFLIHVARTRGKLGKGGVPNLEAAAMSIINDWRDGRIQRWVSPPISSATITESDKVLNGIESGIKDTTSTDSKKIVSEWSKEFDLDALLKTDGSEVTMEDA